MSQTTILQIFFALQKVECRVSQPLKNGKTSFVNSFLFWLDGSASGLTGPSQDCGTNLMDLIQGIGRSPICAVVAGTSFPGSDLPGNGK